MKTISQEDIDLVAKIAEQIGLGFLNNFNAKKWLDNEQVVEIAIQRHPFELRHASKRLRNKEKTVLIAIKRDKRALQFASPRLQKLLK
jgi:hypothetical protein